MRDVAPYISALPAFATLFASIPSCVGSIIKRNDYPLNIDWDPAPPPEEGPPLSINALRDKSFLPTEIGIIVGAYVFVVVVALSVLFIVGRRLRRALEEGAKPKELEMQAALPTNYSFYSSPVSATTAGYGARNFSRPSQERNDQNPYIFPWQNVSPISPGPAVDTKTLETDRENLAQGLGDLYAHVMEQEEAKAAGLSIADRPPPVPPPSISPQRGNTSWKGRLEKPNLINPQAPQKSHSRSSSLMSSLKSPKRKGIRGMKISSPIPTPLSQTFPAHYGSDEEPLSPRHYHPQPPPPIPGTRAAYERGYTGYAGYDDKPHTNHSRNASSINTAQNPSPVSPTRSIAEQMSTLSMRPPPNNRSVATSRPPNLTIPVPRSTQPAPPITTSATNTIRQLPFRAFDPPPGLSSPAFSHTTKTTVLERTTPHTPGLKTPWSVGAVPYTPYQPFTPLVPITPRLVTREDRKAMKRLEPKSPVMEMVPGEEDLWDSGY